MRGRNAHRDNKLTTGHRHLTKHLYYIIEGPVVEQTLTITLQTKAVAYTITTKNEINK